MGKNRRRWCPSTRPECRHIGDLADDVLELVLLSIGSPICLVRASATCKPWRRLIAGAGFLSRFRFLHGPHVLGHYCYNAIKTTFAPWQGDCPVLVPDRVSLDFLPTRSYLELSDCRGGLLAFVKYTGVILVCDPWTREYKEIDHPRIGLRVSYAQYVDGTFLLDAADDEAGTSRISNFRVLCVHAVYSAKDTSCPLIRLLG